MVRIPGYRSRGPRFDSRHCHLFWEVVGLERGPLSLVSTTEELFGRKSSGSGLENRKYGRTDPSRWPRDTLYPQKLALTSPTSGGRSISTVRSQTQATEFIFTFLQQSWGGGADTCLQQPGEILLRLKDYGIQSAIQLFLVDGVCNQQWDFRRHSRSLLHKHECVINFSWFLKPFFAVLHVIETALAALTCTSNATHTTYDEIHGDIAQQWILAVRVMRPIIYTMKFMGTLLSSGS
jgi:hypothetical protein